MENMDKRKMYFISLSAGMAIMSVVSVLLQLLWQFFDNYGGLAIILLRIYIFLAGINLIEVYLRSILPKKRKLTNGLLNSIFISTLLIFISVEQPVGLWIQVLLEILAILISIFIIILFYVVKYFVQKAYSKRVNKKLAEYKQKPDDDTDK